MIVIILVFVSNASAMKSPGEDGGEGTMAGEPQQKQAAPRGKKPASHKIKRGSAVHHGVPVLVVGVFILAAAPVGDCVDPLALGIQGASDVAA